MKELPFIASIAERDIDFVLFEELSVNEEFCDWLTSRLYCKPIFSKSIGAWHSVNDSALGETDVLYLFRSDDDGRFAVLIENKIDAAPQPQQAERYRLRGEKGKQAKDWDDYMTCVVAPGEYLGSQNNVEGYQARISYEELMSFFISRRGRDQRHNFKARLLLGAIEKHRRGYRAEISPAMTEFVKNYRLLALAISPECGVQDAKPRPAGSTWVTFKPDGTPSTVSLVHQLTGGFAKLLISQAADRADALREQFLPFLTDGVEFDVTGKSVSLGIQVPKVEPLTRSVRDEETSIREGVLAIGRLAAIYRQATRMAGNPEPARSASTDIGVLK